MATKFQTASIAATGRAIGAPTVWDRARRAYAKWQERSLIRWELAQMTTRELADLGLNPSDIDDVARGTYRRV